MKWSLKSLISVATLFDACFSLRINILKILLNLIFEKKEYPEIFPLSAYCGIF
jgi:hypothetical protein